MKCIILCAGHNDEKSIPKALKKITEDKTALDLLIEKITKIKEIDKIYVVTNGANFEKFNEWHQNNNLENIKIINDNTTSPNAKLGAIGDIKFTLNCENIDDDLFIIAGDAVYEFEFEELFNFYKEKKSAVVAVNKLKNPVDSQKYGLIKFDENKKVTEMKEKVIDKLGTYMALAFYIYPKETIRIFDYYLSEGNLRTYPGYFLEYLYQIMDVYAKEINGNYYTID